MAEMSYLWTTSSNGDGTSTYSRADWSVIAKLLAAGNGLEGVIPRFLNELEGTVTGANAVSINTGGGVVDGKPYQNGSATAVAIPSASGGGNTRIDRIVLRASWSAQTVRITRIAGTDAASPTAPDITQTSGTTYDIPLYRALVNTSGTVTLTDERVWAGYQADDSSLEVVDGILQIKDLGVVLAMLAADSVDDTKAGSRVPQFYRRQGGSATNWATAGTTSRTPEAVRMQAGQADFGSINPGVSATVAITFPTAFSNVPLVIATAMRTAGAGTEPVVVFTGSITSSGFTLYAHNAGASLSGTMYVTWLAFGPE